MENINEDSAKVDEQLSKKHPDVLYHGDVAEYEDRLDYVNLRLKGVRVG